MGDWWLRGLWWGNGWGGAPKGVIGWRLSGWPVDICWQGAATIFFCSLLTMRTLCPISLSHRCHLLASPKGAFLISCLRRNTANLKFKQDTKMPLTSLVFSNMCCFCYRFATDVQHFVQSKCCSVHFSTPFTGSILSGKVESVKLCQAKLSL